MWVRKLLGGAVAKPTVALMIGIVALTCAWGLSTRPFTSADEPAQYLRALAVSRLDVFMTRPRGGALAIARREQPLGLRLSAGGYRTEAMNTRVLSVPAEMSPPARSDRCLDGRADAGSGSCPEATYNGTYFPLGYVLPAVGVAVAGNAAVGLWLGRLGSAIGCLTFLLIAVALAARGGRWGILGLLTALSPAVLFWSSMLNPDGLEIAAGLAFACGCLRLAREGGALPGWAAAGTAVSGAVAVVVWALGPLYVAIDLILLLCLVARRPARDLFRSRRKALTRYGLAPALAFGLYCAWSVAIGRTHGGPELSPLLPSPHEALHQLSLVWKQSVGVFGWGNLALPRAIYRGCLLGVVLLVAIAWRHGDRRDRLLLLAAVVMSVVLPVALYQWLLRPPSDQGVQGRYVLPVLMLVPLLAGDVLSRRASKLSPTLTRLGPALGIALVSAIGFGALVYVARTEAGASGAGFAHAGWSPPIGWDLWLLLVAVSAAAFVIAAVGAAAAGRGGAGFGRRRTQATNTQRANATV